VSWRHSKMASCEQTKSYSVHKKSRRGGGGGSRVRVPGGGGGGRKSNERIEYIVEPENRERVPLQNLAQISLVFFVCDAAHWLFLGFEETFFRRNIKIKICNGQNG
jgi:hypothetical protein